MSYLPAVTQALGFLSGLMSIIKFDVGFFPGYRPQGAMVRVLVGLDFSGGLNNAGGDVPDIRLWNEVGGFLGLSVDQGKVLKGKHVDITVDYKRRNSGEQATYTLFSANTDAVCIAFASITWPSGENYAWVGDWGRRCGGTWYYSNVYVGREQHKPDCLWIDANNDQPQTGFQVHWPEFVNLNDSVIDGIAKEQTDKVKYICTAGPPFLIHRQPELDPRWVRHWIPKTPGFSGLDQQDATAIAYGPPRPAASPKDRRDYLQTNGTTVRDMIAMSLVVGDGDTHSAADLCGSETSYGPDFVNVKSGMFCRMSDKTLWPICNGADATDNCFNVDSHKLVINGLAARSEPYNNVIDWTSS